MTRPLIVDLFCGAGGAAAGYVAAGFDVVGVDLQPQPRYPFTFHQGDVIELTAADLHTLGAAAVHASPPCQHYSPLAAYHGDRGRYPDLVAAARGLLQSTGLPYCIENVVQAPLVDPVMLCGAMFGLRLYRHRGFEAHGFELTAPMHPAHAARCSRNGNLPRPGEFMTVTGGKHSKAWRSAAAEAMGVPWMTTIREVCEAIPPAYTRYVGTRLLDAITNTDHRHARAGRSTTTAGGEHSMNKDTTDIAERGRIAAAFAAAYVALVELGTTVGVALDAHRDDDDVIEDLEEAIAAAVEARIGGPVLWTTGCPGDDLSLAASNLREGLRRLS